MDDNYGECQSCKEEGLLDLDKLCFPCSRLKAEAHAAGRREAWEKMRAEYERINNLPLPFGNDNRWVLMRDWLNVATCPLLKDGEG